MVLLLIIQYLLLFPQLQKNYYIILKHILMIRLVSIEGWTNLCYLDLERCYRVVRNYAVINF